MRDRQHAEALQRDLGAEDAMTSVAAAMRGERLRLGAVELLDAFLEEDRQRDGRDDQRQHAVADHRIDDDAP